MKYSRVETYTPCFIFIGFDNPPGTACNSSNNCKWRCSKDTTEQETMNKPLQIKPKKHLRTSTKLYVPKNTAPTTYFSSPKDDFIDNLFPNDKKMQNLWNSVNLSRSFLKEREAKLEMQTKIKEKVYDQPKDNISVSSYDTASILSLEKELCDVEEKLRGAANYYGSKFY